MKLRRWAGFAAMIATFTVARADASPLQAQLEVIRAKYNLPALGGAIFTADGVQEMAVTGVRKRGDTTPATVNDLWHLGSDTKAMTAALAGTFVAEKKFAWDDKIISFFPEIANDVPNTMKTVTVADVLRHKAGLIENLDWHAIAQGNASLTRQRLYAAHEALFKPAYAPGAFHYANTDYVVIGAILEKIGGAPWEDLIRQRIFKPLGMNSAGFGGTGTPGQVDQPWPHDGTGAPAPINGPTADNPPNIGPAGIVHCSMADWSKFLIDQLDQPRAGSGEGALLLPEIYQAMQSDPTSKGDGYGFGWGICTRDWAGGKALNHAGSNTMNFCDAWLAPGKKFGVLVVCNQGGDAAANAGDQACFMLIQRHLAATKP